MKYSDLAIRDYYVTEYLNKKYSRRLARLKKEIIDDIESRIPRQERKAWRLGINLMAIRVEHKKELKK